MTLPRLPVARVEVLLSRAKRVPLRQVQSASTLLRPAPVLTEVLQSTVPANRSAPESPGLAMAHVESIEGDDVRLIVGRAIVVGKRDPGLHEAVLAGAMARGERVLVERDAAGAWVVVGALRMQPTPGIDVADEYTIEARRVLIRGREEVTLTAHAASVVVRALGEVETYAERILSRADGVHKIIGRILRLN